MVKHEPQLILTSIEKYSFLHSLMQTITKKMNPINTVLIKKLTKPRNGRDPADSDSEIQNSQQLSVLIRVLKPVSDISSG